MRSTWDTLEARKQNIVSGKISVEKQSVFSHSVSRIAAWRLTSPSEGSRSKTNPRPILERSKRDHETARLQLNMFHVRLWFRFNLITMIS